MLLVPLFFVVLIWYLIICYKWKKNLFDHLEKIPGIQWRPFFGTTYPFIGATKENVLYKFVEIAMKYKPFFRTWNGGVGEVNIMKPDHLQIIMSSSSHTTKGPFYQVLFPWLGEGLFMSEGAKWFLQRKLLTPTFHFKILEGFVANFGNKAQAMVEQLKARANGEFFDIVPFASCCTLGIIFDSAMGVPLRDITNDPMDYVKSLYGITELALWRYWRPYVKDSIFYFLPQGRQYRQHLKNLKSYSSRIIEYKKEALRKKQALIGKNGVEEVNEETSFLDMILDAKDNKCILTDSDMISLIDTFLAAGYETTANTVSWALFLLGNHPDLQERLFEEVRGILGDKPSPTSIAQLSEFKYLECVVKETLRLYPVLPFIARRITEGCKIDGYNIPPDTQAILHIFQVQRDPEHFPEPDKFDPERFTVENSKGRHPFAYIPFSAGPRNCIGQRFALLETKAILATIVNKFRVTSMKKPEEVLLYAHVLLRSQGGLHIKLESRE